MFKLCLLALLVVLAVAQVSAGKLPVQEQNQIRFVDDIIRNVVAKFRDNIARNFLGEDSPDAGPLLTPTTDDVLADFFVGLLNAQNRP